MRFELSRDGGGGQSKMKNRYTATEEKLKHNTAKKNKQENFSLCVQWYRDDCQ